ncbi:MAG: hypothetical protein ACJAZ9_000517 [Neolewinella sp.]|jgi:hypothetical protein
MRKTLPLLILLFLASGLSAQTFQASIVAGMNISQIDGDDLFGFHKVGVNSGLRVVAKLNDRWRIGPEILFSQQGAYKPNSSPNGSPFTRFHLNTLEVPLMVFYKDWRITAEGGFSFQRLFSYEIDDFQGEDITSTIAFKDNLIAFKAGVTFYVKPNLGINMRWSKHLTNIDIDNAINTSFKGRTISLRLVYTLGEGEEIPKPTITE